jgi:hypothetical protein
MRIGEGSKVSFASYPIQPIHIDNTDSSGEVIANGNLILPVVSGGGGGIQSITVNKITYSEANPTITPVAAAITVNNLRTEADENGDIKSPNITGQIKVNGSTFSPDSNTNITDIGYFPTKSHDTALSVGWNDFGSLRNFKDIITSGAAADPVFSINIIGTPAPDGNYAIDFNGLIVGTSMRIQPAVNDDTQNIRSITINNVVSPVIRLPYFRTQSIVVGIDTMTWCYITALTILNVAGSTPNCVQVGGGSYLDINSSTWPNPLPARSLFYFSHGGGTIVKAGDMPAASDGVKYVGFGRYNSKLIITGEWPGFNINNITNPTYGTCIVNGRQICPIF